VSLLESATSKAAPTVPVAGSGAVFDLCTSKRDAWLSFLEFSLFLFAIGAIWTTVYYLVVIIAGV
jgi:hypothetical protein